MSKDNKYVPCRHRWVDDELGSEKPAYCEYCGILYNWWMEHGDE